MVRLCRIGVCGGGRVLRFAAALSALAGEPDIQRVHVIEAAAYRGLDRPVSV